MAVNAKLEFEKLRVNIEREVAERKNGRTFIKRLKTKVGLVDSASLATACRQTVGKVVSITLGHIPFVGGAIAKAAELAMNKVTAAALADGIKDKESQGLNAMQERGELLVASTVQKYVNAVYRYGDAFQEAENARPKAGLHFHNCAEIAAYLRAVYYWKHRMAKLRRYHDQILAYTNVVGNYLNMEEASFQQFHTKLQAQGEAMFAGWQWHFANCTDECYWPEDFATSMAAENRQNASERVKSLANAGVAMYSPKAFSGRYDSNGNPIMTGPPVIPRVAHRPDGPRPPAYPPPAPPRH
ncbi:MAG: hypothetical protein ABSH56_08490 [Bryobacteraceae bacterium]